MLRSQMWRAGVCRFCEKFCTGWSFIRTVLLPARPRQFRVQKPGYCTQKTTQDSKPRVEVDNQVKPNTLCQAACKNDRPSLLLVSSTILGGIYLLTLLWDYRFSRRWSCRCWSSGLQPLAEEHTASTFSAEYGDGMFLRNVVVYLQVHTVLLSRRPTSIFTYLLPYLLIYSFISSFIYSLIRDFLHLS
jgi:hypothetical protein